MQDKKATPFVGRIIRVKQLRKRFRLAVGPIQIERGSPIKGPSVSQCRQAPP